MKPRSYEQAGVSIDRGDAFAAMIASMQSGSLGELGGFAGGMEIDLKRYRRPVLMSTTDGVGTKLLVAQRLGDYTTVGIDLVAMCVNDLAVCGADPMVFLDYIACGRINDQVLRQVMTGIVDGCEQAGCTLSGGETAELPDMYGADDIDLAGFAVGLVDFDERLPHCASISSGDRIVGLASSGIHSNGFSLARRVIDSVDEGAWRELLTPTRIYVEQLRRARPLIKAAAHVTGGGLEANLLRVLPEDASPALHWNWEAHPIFDRIQRDGRIEIQEMRRVFNMGVGIALVTEPHLVDRLAELVGEPLVDLGSVSRG